jgi:hypothetical protein
MNHDEPIETTGKPFFYQYRPINDRLIENLSKNQIFFNNPNEFNDPFDSQYNIYFEGDRTQFLSFFDSGTRTQIRIRNLYNDDGEDDELAEPDFFIGPEELLNVSFKNKKVQQDGNLIRSTPLWEEKIDEIKLPTACFSVDCKNVLMWSHYANYHKGACLIYKSEGEDYNIKLGTAYQKFQIVTYDENVPNRVNFLNQDEKKKIIDFVLTKSPCWKYEKEYRIILSDSKDKYKIEKYDKKDLVGIIFGLKVNCCDAHRVYKTIVDNYGTDFKFFEAIQEVVKEQDKEDVKKYAIRVNEISNIHNYLKLLREKYNKKMGF